MNISIGQTLKSVASPRWGLLCLLMLAEPQLALAHAKLDHAEPAVGSKIKPAPDQVKIWFTDGLDPAHSSIEVKNAKGKEVDKKDAHVDSKDGSLLMVSLPNLPPGVYTVNWHVVCEDGHKTQGHFEFTVKDK
jgi:methionine-rich copper-binding protein CopC